MVAQANDEMRFGIISFLGVYCLPKCSKSAPARSLMRREAKMA